jgi:hypothetical protein
MLSTTLCSGSFTVDLAIVKLTELYNVLLKCCRRRCSSVLKAVCGAENKNVYFSPPVNRFVKEGENQTKNLIVDDFICV